MDRCFASLFIRNNGVIRLCSFVAAVSVTICLELRFRYGKEMEIEVKRKMNYPLLSPLGNCFFDIFSLSLNPCAKPNCNSKKTSSVLLFCANVKFTRVWYMGRMEE